MHFLYCIISGLIVCVIGLIFIAVRSKEVDPTDKKDAPIIHIDEDITREIRYEWREKEKAN